MKKFAVLGYPLSHTLSPKLHRRLWQLLPPLDIRDHEYKYEVLEIAPGKHSEHYMRRLISDYSGLNVTIPHKLSIMEYLDDIDETAKNIGSVNTVKNAGGCLVGYNTDYLGLEAALKKYGMDISGEVCIYGCGGAARAAAALVSNAGGHLTVAVREPEKGEAFLKDFPALKSSEVVSLIADGEFETIINCTPVGMYPINDECVVPDFVIQKCKNVFDMVYNPKDTQLVLGARELGKNAESGMAMLVYQAIYGQSIWRSDYKFPYICDVSGTAEKVLNELSSLF
jgi:shikimate dehydrogenase